MSGQEPSTNAAVLVIDLDGTLHHGDMAALCARSLAVRKPWLLPSMLAWLARGRLNMKLRLAERTDIDMANIDWNLDVVNFAKEQSRTGRRLVLATAATHKIAAAARDHLASAHGLVFDKVLCSTADTNLLGHAKADAIEADAGEAGFDYVGDSPTQDAPVFRRARASHFVAPTKGMLERFQTADSRVFAGRTGAWRRLRRSLLSMLQEKPAAGD